MTVPLSGRDRPDKALSSVDFPEPDSPTMPRTSPGYKSKDTSWQPCDGPYRRLRLRTLNNGVMQPPLWMRFVYCNSRCLSKRIVVCPDRRQSVHPDTNWSCCKTHSSGPTWESG